MKNSTIGRLLRGRGMHVELCAIQMREIGVILRKAHHQKKSQKSTTKEVVVAVVAVAAVVVVAVEAVTGQNIRCTAEVYACL